MTYDVHVQTAGFFFFFWRSLFSQELLIQCRGTCDEKRNKMVTGKKDKVIGMQKENGRRSLSALQSMRRTSRVKVKVKVNQHKKSLTTGFGLT